MTYPTTHVLLSPMAAREGGTLRVIGRNEWPVEWFGERSVPTLAAWISREYLVQLFAEPAGLRLTVNRTRYQIIGKKPQWLGGISWDELQAIKRQCGYGDRWAVEIFPPDEEVVNVANLRHLWLLPAAPEYGWHTDDEGKTA